MKLKFLSFFLCVCFLLGGCRASDGAPSETAEANPSSTETAPEETTPTEPAASPKETEEAVPSETITAAALSLNDVPYGKLNSLALTFRDPAMLRYWGELERAPKNYSFQYRDGDKMAFRDVLRARAACPTVGYADEEKAEVCRFVKECEFLLFSEWGVSPYRLSERTDGTELTVEEIEGGSVYIGDLLCGYKVGGEVTLRAFVTKAEDGNILVIPDPRYLSGLPVFETNFERMEFDLDGLKLTLDSFPVNAWCISAVKEKLDERTEGFLYAQVTLRNLKVNYSFSSGYDCSAYLKELTPITVDLEAAVSGPFLMPEEGKDPEMAAVYTALLENADLLYTEDTYGIILLDLDFDGTPEVLRTRCDAELLKGASEWTHSVVDIDIYRIENEKLRYLDSFESAIYSLGSHDRIEALLGQKTLSDGTRGWYGVSNQNFKTKEKDGEYCYFYRLNGDTLTVTEFASARTETLPDGEEVTRFFYYGEEMDIQEKDFPTVDIAGDEYVEKEYEWNGRTVLYSPYLLFLDLKNEFIEEISEVHILFSDWIIPYQNQTVISEWDGQKMYYYNGLDKYRKKELTLMDLSYEFAYLVDAFYLGYYSPEGGKYLYSYEIAMAKPVIYLYPEEETEVSVQVNFTEGGELTCTYPEYGNGWEVTALPDGTIYDKDGNEYYCLYWEGEGSANFESGKGWCVAGSDTAAFLREKLLGVGLTAREANEFIIYWLPELQKNPYNIITFHTDDYAKSVPLTVSPTPDTIIRVFMTYEPVDVFTSIEPQELPHYEREGFTLVEWGGSPAGEAILR